MCLKTEKSVYLGEFQLDQTLGMKLKGTGTVLGTLTDRRLSPGRKLLRQKRHDSPGSSAALRCSHKSEFHAVVWDFRLATRRGPCVQRACHHHIPHCGDGHNRAQCLSMWRNGYSRAQVQATLG